MMILKDIRIKLTQIKKKKTNSIWEDSPCSYNYVSESAIIDMKTPRFQIGSIYVRDGFRKDLVVDYDLEKPERLLLLFRKQIEDASQSKVKWR